MPDDLITSESQQIEIVDDEQGIIISESNQTVIVTEQVTEIITEGAQGPRGVSAEDELPFAKRADIVDGFNGLVADPDFETIYLADAEVGTLDAAALWRIKRIIIDNASDGDAVTEWAELAGQATAEFVHVWNDRLTFAYS